MKQLIAPLLVATGFDRDTPGRGYVGGIFKYPAIGKNAVEVAADTAAGQGGQAAADLPADARVAGQEVIIECQVGTARGPRAGPGANAKGDVDEKSRRDLILNDSQVPALFGIFHELNQCRAGGVSPRGQFKGLVNIHMDAEAKIDRDARCESPCQPRATWYFALLGAQCQPQPGAFGVEVEQLAVVAFIAQLLCQALCGIGKGCHEAFDTAALAVGVGLPT